MKNEYQLIYKAYQDAYSSFKWEKRIHDTKQDPTRKHSPDEKRRGGGVEIILLVTLHKARRHKMSIERHLSQSCQSIQLLQLYAWIGNRKVTAVTTVC